MKLPKFTLENATELINLTAEHTKTNYAIAHPFGRIVILNTHDGTSVLTSFYYNKAYKSLTATTLNGAAELEHYVGMKLRTLNDHTRAFVKTGFTGAEYMSMLLASELFLSDEKQNRNCVEFHKDFLNPTAAFYKLDITHRTDHMIKLALSNGEPKKAAAVEPPTPPTPPTVKVEPAVIVAPIAKPTPKANNLDAIDVPTTLSLEGMIAATVRNAVKSEFTEDMLEHVLHAKLDEYGIKPKVKTVVIDNKITGKKVDMGGMMHKTFEKVLKYATCRVNIFLTGETGSGKTTAAYNLGKAMGLEVYSKSVGIETGMHEFMGHINLDGKPIETDFERAYKNGGIFLVDEIDGGNPNVLLALNQALGNPICTFASGAHTKHDDFICVAGANTWGFGATPEYVGRNPIDGATLNRFVTVYYGYDEDLELQLAGNDAWAKEVQAMRANCKNKRVKHIISPRASIMGAKLLAAGIDKETVLKDVVFQGLSQDEINLIKL